MFNFAILHYTELALDEFHDIIQLRIAIFVVEQNCPYQELDGKDKESFHLICKNENEEIVATLRILPPHLSYETVAIGRIVVHEKERGKSLGHKLIEKSMQFIEEEFGTVPVTLSAQKHLEGFYEKHKFKSTGKEYLEDGIPHVEMYFSPTKIV